MQSKLEKARADLTRNTVSDMMFGIWYQMSTLRKLMAGQGLNDSEAYRLMLKAGKALGDALDLERDEERKRREG